MVEYLGDLASAVAMILAAAAGGFMFYNSLVSHREVTMQKREALYYRLFEDQDDDEFDERSDEPYYED